jgi:isopenicillin N synthase-like dioxygenase
MSDVPEIDVGALLDGGDSSGSVATAIDEACRNWGFFYVVGHDVDHSLQQRLDALSRDFFARPEDEKVAIAMSRAGRAWRGWFPLGGELTSGVPDQKEGLYFGSELSPGHPRVVARTPLHGSNLFPGSPAGLRAAVLEYMDAMTRLGQSVLCGIAVALRLESSWFEENLTHDPLVLFRIFRYPPVTSEQAGRWSVGEHTDYGLLTILAQDDSGGLQVKTPAGWIDVQPRPGTFVCNLGDMLERLTGGRYRSTPHRVRNSGTGDRLSFPFFLDPSWDAIVRKLPIVDRPDDYEAAQRWDHTNVHGFEGTYGEYILTKVGRVFPDLASGAISTV